MDLPLLALRPPSRTGILHLCLRRPNYPDPWGSKTARVTGTPTWLNHAMQIDFLVALRFSSHWLSLFVCVCVYLKRAALSRRGEGRAHSPWRKHSGIPFPYSASQPPSPLTLFGLINVQQLHWLLQFLPEIGRSRAGRSLAYLGAHQGPTTVSGRQLVGLGTSEPAPAWAGRPGWLYKVWRWARPDPGTLLPQSPG